MHQLLYLCSKTVQHLCRVGILAQLHVAGVVVVIEGILVLIAHVNVNVVTDVAVLGEILIDAPDMTFLTIELDEFARHVEPSVEFHGQ